jgi:hypothetical protein
MTQQGPFDRRMDPAGRDKTARLILLGMGVIGLVLLILVLPPISLLSGGGGVQNASPGNQTANGARSIKAPRLPEGYEMLSPYLKPAKPREQADSYALTVPLLQPLSDGRNLALYTNEDGKWERLATASLINNGASARAELSEIPSNVAVLRRTVNAAAISGSLAAGAQPDPAALDFLATISPVDYMPAPDGGVTGNATGLPQGRGNVIPTVRASGQREIDAVNTILASPGLREAHVNALVQLALQPGYAGVDIDYPKVNAARKADFTAFVTVLGDRLRQSTRTLSVTVPTPIKNGVSWDTGAYDWEQLGDHADVLKLTPEPDPSVYFGRMEDVLNFLKPKLPLSKVVLGVTRQSYEKGTDGLRSITLTEGLTLASTVEVRTTSQITPNSSVVIVGKNIFQDDGASGLRWDEQAFAVAFSYPGRGGQRTVWLENALSLAFKLDLARRYGLGGVALDDVSLNSQSASLWEPLRLYAESGTVALVQPNGVMLRPSWQIQAGASEPGTKGNIVWKAPAQPGAYDVSLIVSDGVIRAAQKIVLEVRPAAAASSPTGPGPTPAGAIPAPTVRP